MERIYLPKHQISFPFASHGHGVYSILNFPDWAIAEHMMPAVIAAISEGVWVHGRRTIGSFQIIGSDLIIVTREEM